MRYLFILLLLLPSCKGDRKYHDEVGQTIEMVEDDALSSILEFQKKLNAEFKNPETSPLPDRYRKDFESLDFFTPDTNYVVRAKLVRTPEALPFDMPTTTERVSKERVYGLAHFVLKGRPYQLEMYQNEELIRQEGYEDYLFLPFADATNGEQTYAGGRYIDLRIPKGDSIIIDFNKAYNPYCVYNKKYSCPIVPSVNALDIPILAGVKDFGKGK
ncbi:DUF1684 domain-containing protein [Flavobacteriaceae bacterium TP-CH-4]|uniref:DUF1684 domain-containing protein n=1 Tax=Pelagihabitans pacificus TaxID=2696054 RepID=A0A967ARK3_9FLAO|nr:DUF1684 domain-containing protein [Pelagihabitans pacificus]NHF57910.1 DUF1684 domain-containing protein [Pelagihabitans pacificus]